MYWSVSGAVGLGLPVQVMCPGKVRRGRIGVVHVALAGVDGICIGSHTDLMARLVVEAARVNTLAFSMHVLVNLLQGHALAPPVLTGRAH